MNEEEWLKAKNPEAMLGLVAPHLSPRQWDLLSCMFVRRLGKLLENERLQRAVAWVEANAGTPQAAGGAAVREAIPLGVEEAVVRADEEQRGIVQLADPDADLESFLHVEGRKTNPAAPLFQAAAERARRALESTRQAVTLTGAAVDRLFAGIRTAEDLQQLRRQVVAGTEAQAVSAVQVNLALKLKGRGDDAADRDNRRDVRQRYAAALEAVDREEEYAGYRENDVAQQRARADLKALGKLLSELCGNVCRPPVFDPMWRTSDVVALAETIETERSFAAMPVLNDALLDAGCNSRQILRHCRGLKEHADEPIQHAPGCWVIELILEREQAFRSQLPLGQAKAIRVRKPKRR